jgi:hypothetical protein
MKCLFQSRRKPPENEVDPKILQHGDAPLSFASPSQQGFTWRSRRKPASSPAMHHFNFETPVSR